jgi:hypothetical protein
MNDLLKRKPDLPEESTFSWWTRFTTVSRPFTLYIPLDEKQVARIIKDIPRRHDDAETRYTVRMRVESGRRAFFLRHYIYKGDQWIRQRTISATLHSDPNLMTTRISGRLYHSSHDSPVEIFGIIVVIALFLAGCICIALLAKEFHEVIRLLIAVLLGILIIFLLVFGIYESVTVFFRDRKLIDFLESELMQQA